MEEIQKTTRKSKKQEGTQQRRHSYGRDQRRNSSKTTQEVRRNSLGKCRDEQSPPPTSAHKSLSQRFSSFRSKTEKSSSTPSTAASTKEGPFHRFSFVRRRSHDGALKEVVDSRYLEEDEEEGGSMEDVIVTANHDADCEVSQITMQTKDFVPRMASTSFNYKDQEHLKRLSALLGDLSESDSYREKAETNALFTFQRTCTLDANKVFSTTLNAKSQGDTEETMEDLVKRLQKMGNTSSVLKFEKQDIVAIKSGTKQVVFSLTQVKGAVFNKQEFGKMTVSEMMTLSTERPIVIEITTEDLAQGETFDVF